MEVINQRLSDLFQSFLTRAFTGELTAAWRARRAEQLAAEARQRDEALGLRPRVARRVEEIIAPTPAWDEARARWPLLDDLGPAQQQIYQAIQETVGYFSAGGLASAHGWLEDAVRRTLDLLETLGLVARASLPRQPLGEEGGFFYVPAYRAAPPDDDRADALSALEAAHPGLAEGARG